MSNAFGCNIHRRITIGNATLPMTVASTVNILATVIKNKIGMFSEQTVETEEICLNLTDW